MEVLFFLLFVVVIGGSIIAGVIYNHGVTVEAWKLVAQRYDLSFEPGGALGGMKMWGELNGHSVVLDTHSRDKQTFLRYRVHYQHPLDFSLEITREHLFSGITKLLGSQDIEIGDEDFDKLAMIKGSDERRVRELLTPRRRQAIAAALDALPRLKVTGDALHWDDPILRDTQKIVASLERLVMLADVISRDDDEPSSGVPKAETPSSARAVAAGVGLGGAATMAAAGSVPDQDDAPRQIEEEAPAPPVPVIGREEPETPPPILTSEPSSPAPIEPPPALSEIEPAEPPPLGGRLAAGTSDEDAPLQADSGQAESEAEPAEPDLGPGDAALLCQALFGPGSSSLSAENAFTERFDGLTVRWQGLLRSVSSFSYDTVFGDGPACKAQLHLLEVEGDYGSRRMIEAVVQLPPELERPLSRRIGETITFSGTLHRVDGLMHKIFVRSGEAAAG